MSVSIRIKRNRLYLDVIVSRKHYWQSLNIVLSNIPQIREEQLKLAEVARAKKELEIACSEWGIPTQHLLNKTLFSLYEDLIQIKPYIKTAYGSIKKFCQHDLPLKAINEKFVVDYQNYLKNSNIAINTASMYDAVLKHVLTQAVKQNIIRNTPYDNVKRIPLVMTCHPTLTVEEIKKISQVNLKFRTQKEVRRAFLFACYTGLRVSDLCSLTYDDIIRSSTGYFIQKRMKKTGRIVTLPLSDVAYRLIEKQTNFDGYVFRFTNKCKTYVRSYCDKVIKRIMEKCGISKNVSWHTARRTFATLLLENNTDVFTIQRMLGHTNINTTSLYAHTCDDMKCDAIKKLENVLAMG